MTTEDLKKWIHRYNEAVNTIREQMITLQDESKVVLIVQQKIKNSRLHLLDAVNELESAERILNWKPNEKED